MSEVPAAGIDRRTLLRRGMVAGGIVMATPVINTFVLPAVAQAVSGVSKVVDFELPVLGVGPASELELTTYGDFTWTGAWLYRPGPTNPFGYAVGSGAQIAFVGSPQGTQPLVVQSPNPVYFTSVFLTNPTGSETDPDGPITVRVEALRGGVSQGVQTFNLVDGESTVAILAFPLADTLTLLATGNTAGGKYFGIDDLTYSVP